MSDTRTTDASNALALCFFGIQVSWAAQIAQASPLMLALGLSPRLLSLVWLAGPVSGLFVQPAVGAVSDALGGRRRPFIAGGAVLAGSGLALLSLSTVPGAAVVAFWILDIANNTVQGPARALMVDLVPVSQHAAANARISFAIGAGNLLCFAVASQLSMQAVFLFAMAIMLAAVAAALFLLPPAAPDGPKERSDRGGALSRLTSVLVHDLSGDLGSLCAAQFCVWLSWFVFFIFATPWVAIDVFGGDPGAPAGSPARRAFDDGVQLGSLGLALQSLVTLVAARALPPLIRASSERVIWASAHAVFAVCLAVPYWGASPTLALVLFAMTGLPWAATITIPFILAGKLASADVAGAVLGVLNIFVVVPQLVVSLFFSPVASHFGLSISAILGTGGVAAMCALPVILALRSGESKS